MHKHLILAFIGMVLALPTWATPLPLNISEADTIYYRPGRTIPSFVRFDRPQKIDLASFGTYLQRLFEQRDPFVFTQVRSESDLIGMTHIRLQQKRGPFPIEGAIWTLHLDAQGYLVSMGGLLFAPAENAQLPLLNQDQAFQQALASNPAERYQWENKLEGLPAGQLIWSPPAGNFHSSQLRLAYKFDIYTSVPLARNYTYIDAINGDLLWQEQRLQHVDTDSIGIAATSYSGTRKITTRYNGDRFSLIDLSRGQGIYTLDAARRYYWWLDVAPFTDDDNTWDNINSNRDQFATDAHWGTAQTYEYIQQILGRYSLDDQGYPLVSHVHVGLNFRNAFWDGQAMYYGDGDSLGGQVNPLVSIDIVAHEVAHGLTQFTAGLIYASESGALNESYSDIMGKIVQHWSKPETFDWIIGAEANFPIRSMLQPNDFGHPNTYFGNFWDSFERVHTNSSVQNHWFYLLSEGGSGNNDFGSAYSVEGLGFEKPAQIAFRSLFYYLHPSTTYEEARLYSLQAATDLYGACSAESEQVINAWHAVGVGEAFSAPSPEANFTYSDSILCSYPLELQFTNLSKHGNAFVWDFGDGNSSEEYSPSHAYETPGQYTVSLSLSGECGTDNKTLNKPISVQSPPEAPYPINVVSLAICGEELEWVAEAAGQVVWYDDSARLVAFGERLYLSDFMRSTTYSAHQLVPKQSYQVYPELNQDSVPEIRDYAHGQYFFNEQLIQLKSFKVMLAEAGEIEVEIFYPDRSRSIKWAFAGEVGENTLQLDQFYEPGWNYLVSVRSKHLVVIPGPVKQDYNLPGLFGLNSSQGDFYNHIYGWEIGTFCQSPPAQIGAKTAVPSPNPIDTTRCGPERFRFFVPSEGYTVNWYNWAHDLIYQGETFETPIIYGNTRYYVEREDVQASQTFGPQLDESSLYPWPQNNFSAIHFTVHEPVIFESFEVMADSAEWAVAFLVEDIPGLQAAFSDSIPAGRQRIAVNWLLPAGNYTMRGNSPHIRVQDQALSFPYEIEGLIQIDSASSPGFIPFFNWQVRPASCWSERVPITINRGLQLDLFADFSYQQNQNLLKFENLSKPYDRVLWDFGDGTYSTEINPTHLFAEQGSYEVGFQIWYGGCSDFITQSINITRVQSFLEIYPNPADDQVVFSLRPLQADDFRLEIFDVSGRRVWDESLGEIGRGGPYFHALDVGDWASGFYIVRMRSAQQSLVGKLQVN
ncbi:MAG: M4 family metallopeptidase [Bacteroidota bacterium]